MPIPKILLGDPVLVPVIGETGWGAEGTDILVTLIDIANVSVAQLADGSLVLVRGVALHAALGAGGTITPTATVMRVVSTGGAVVLDAVTPIANGEFDEQLLEVVGTHAANTVEIPDSGNMDINGLIVLGLGTRLSLAWDDGASLWREISRNN